MRQCFLCMEKFLKRPIQGMNDFLHACRVSAVIRYGISGQIQHTAGMDGSAMIISINTDPEAPINKIADYAITGSVEEVIPKMIKYYKQNSK